MLWRRCLQHCAQSLRRSLALIAALRSAQATTVACTRIGSRVIRRGKRFAVGDRSRARRPSRADAGMLPALRDRSERGVVRTGDRFALTCHREAATASLCRNPSARSCASGPGTLPARPGRAGRNPRWGERRRSRCVPCSTPRHPFGRRRWRRAGSRSDTDLRRDRMRPTRSLDEGERRRQRLRREPRMTLPSTRPRTWRGRIPCGDRGGCARARHAGGPAARSALDQGDRRPQRDTARRIRAGNVGSRIRSWSCR